MKENPVRVDENVILIRINQRYRPGMHGEELYHNTRGVWRLKRKRCENAKYAMTVYRGKIKEIYEINSWHKAKTTEYKYREDLPSRVVPNRSEFTGKIANDKIRNKYTGKSVAHLFNKGNQNPIFYVNC